MISSQSAKRTLSICLTGDRFCLVLLRRRDDNHRLLNSVSFIVILKEIV